MIVLLDIEKQVVSLYNKEAEIPFNQANELFDCIDGNVYYVTNAVETNAQDIVDLIRSTGATVSDDIMQDSGFKYLRGTSEGTIYVGADLKFEGKFDCKLIDEEMKQIIKLTPLLQQLITNKKIEIISESRRKKIMKEFKQYQNKEIEKQKLVDKSLDSIILKDKVDPSNPLIVDDNTPDEAQEINILGRGSGGGGPSFETMSELMTAIDGFET